MHEARVWEGTGKERNKAGGAKGGKVGEEEEGIATEETMNRKRVRVMPFN